MDDLISRQAAIDVLDAYQVMVENGEENPYAWARLRMCELPSAQPSIVMCKDCRYWWEEERQCKGEMGFARHWNADDYCSNGKRREDELQV